jgi:hypothetical protein
MARSVRSVAGNRRSVFSSIASFATARSTLPPASVSSRTSSKSSIASRARSKLTSFFTGRSRRTLPANARSNATNYANAVSNENVNVLRGNVYTRNTGLRPEQKFITLSAPLPAAEQQRIRGLFDLAIGRAQRAHALLKNLGVRAYRVRSADVLSPVETNLLGKYRGDTGLFISDLVRQRKAWTDAVRGMNRGARGPWRLPNWPLTPRRSRATLAETQRHYLVDHPWNFVRSNHQVFMNRIAKSYASMHNKLAK